MIEELKELFEMIKEKVLEKTSDKTENEMLAMGFLIFLVFIFSFVANGAEVKHLKTSFDFEDQIVKGKYQYPDEAVTTVENEKLLKDLLEFRQDFKDRMKQEASRH